ncbi:MAG: type II secretion system F family protein [Candidatus Nealsonbacteria bacterium]
MKFNYQARTKTGEIQSGVVAASSKDAAFEVLKRHGLYVTAIEKSIIPIYAKRLKIFERISEKDIMLFSRQLSIMFKSKVPLVEIFQTIAQQTKNPSFKEKILNISEEVEGGASLSNSLALYPKLFSPFYISLVKSGEASGKLTDVFLYLAEYLEKESNFHGKIRGAMVYPAFIILVFFSVITLVVTFVIPQLAEFLNETEQELPFITKLVLGISEFLKKNVWVVIITFIGLVFLSYKLIKTKEGKRIFNENILRLPIMSPFFKKLYLARFALNLSTLISGGLPIVQSLQITSEVVGNETYKKLILEVRDGVKKGEKMSSILKNYPNLISPLFYQMTVIGEKTGTLDKSLTNVVDFYQDDIDRSTDNMVKLMEPILIIILGVVVGGLMAAVLMPLYSFGTI